MIEDSPLIMLDSTEHDGLNDSSAKMKVLISAYACGPRLGSEPGIGWNTVSQMARHHEVWVLTNIEQQEAIERELDQNPLPNAHWIYVEVPSWLTRPWQKGERGRRLHYWLWQYWAYRTAKQLFQQVPFDVVHHITFGSYWTPSYLSLLGLPFVWGPVGGGEGTPFRFYSTLSWHSARNEFFRDAIRWLCHHFDPFVRSTAKHAAISLAATEETATKLQHLGAKNIQIMSACALPQNEIEQLSVLADRRSSETFRLLSVGRLLAWKGYHLGIHAFAKVHAQFPSSEYWIIGEGPESDRLKALAAELGVAESVRFTGLVTREEALECMAQAKVLLHPSLHDSGSWVGLEAMAAGLPVVCLRRGGLSSIVSDETGFLIAAETPQEVIDELAAALLQLAQNPNLRHQFGLAGQERVRKYFEWSWRGREFDQVYRTVVAHAVR